MKTIMLLVGMCISVNVFSQNFEWIKSAGDLERDAGRTVCIDKDGNIIVGGYFSGKITFDSTTYIGRGIDDIFFAKYNQAGTLLWVKTAGGPNNDAAYGIGTDSEGNIFISGYFDSIAYFDNLLITGNGSSDIFLAKYTSDGNLIWVKNAGGLGLDEAQDIAIDRLGDAYITGRFSSFAAFGGTVITSKGNTDIFVAKYSNAGNIIWVKRAGGTQEDIAFGIDLDNQRSCYITGYFKNRADFGGFELLTTSISTEIFTAKIDSINQWEWVEQAGSLVGDAAFDIAVDANRNSYITGYYADNATFGSNTITSEGYNDIFVAKYNPKGLCLWVKSAGGLNLDLGSGIDVASDGSIFVCGSIDSFSYFGQSTTIGSKLQTDMFVAKWDNDGNFNWVLWAGGPNFQFALALTVGLNKSIYTTGYYYSQIQSPDSVINIFQQQDADIFLCKINDPLLSISSKEKDYFFNVFPNPASGEIFFKRNNISKKPIQSLIIFDITGKQKKVNFEENDSLIKVDISSYTNSICFYQITLEDGSIISGKIIKQ